MQTKSTLKENSNKKGLFGFGKKSKKQTSMEETKTNNPLLGNKMNGKPKIKDKEREREKSPKKSYSMRDLKNGLNNNTKEEPKENMLTNPIPRKSPSNEQKQGQKENVNVSRSLDKMAKLERFMVTSRMRRSSVTKMKATTIDLGEGDRKNRMEATQRSFKEKISMGKNSPKNLYSINEMTYDEEYQEDEVKDEITFSKFALPSLQSKVSFEKLKKIDRENGTLRPPSSRSRRSKTNRMSCDLEFTSYHIDINDFLREPKPVPCDVFFPQSDNLKRGLLVSSLNNIFTQKREHKKRLEKSSERVEKEIPTTEKKELSSGELTTKESKEREREKQRKTNKLPSRTLPKLQQDAADLSNPHQRRDKLVYLTTVIFEQESQKFHFSKAFKALVAPDVEKLFNIKGKKGKFKVPRKLERDLPNLSENKPEITRRIKSIISRIEEILVDENLSFCYEIGVLLQMNQSDALEGYTKSLVNIYCQFSRKKDQSLHSLLANSVSFEINKAFGKESAVSTLFRDQSFCTLLFSHYSFNCSKKYISETIRPTITKIFSLKKPLEVDPNKVTSEDQLEYSFQQLSSLVSSFLEHLFKTIHLFPVQLRRLLSRVKEECLKKFSAEVSVSLLSVFVFLRFLCPAIVTPLEYGITKEQATKEIRRSLILFVKILSNISTGVEFDGTKESFMLGYNQMVLGHRSKMMEFFNELVSLQSIELVESKIKNNPRVKFSQSMIVDSFVQLLQSMVDSRRVLLMKSVKTGIDLKLAGSLVKILEKLYENFEEN